eukprot:TRINITY_DN3071_c0_g1_i1.p1 TRINITY_DN3071_c0_g1~~TRINITY_DN3071_c0_g1_i1.p1  ORF type:complete len:253 (+),score=66.66 TRINITY_DN3071_c0_g1_i1:83-841(+)
MILFNLIFLAFSAISYADNCHFTTELPSTYLDEQIGCFVGDLKKAIQKQNVGTILTKCSSSENTKRLCTNSGGTMCPYEGTFGILISGTTTLQTVDLSLEVCVPSTCSVDDLKAVESVNNLRFDTLLGCTSDSTICQNKQFHLNCPALVAPSTSSTNWPLVITLAVLILVLVLLLGGLSYYVYQKIQTNPERSVTDVLKDMPPMKVTTNFFSESKKSIIKNFKKDANQPGQPENQEADEEDLPYDPNQVFIS